MPLEIMQNGKTIDLTAKLDHLTGEVAFLHGELVAANVFIRALISNHPAIEGLAKAVDAEVARREALNRDWPAKEIEGYEHNLLNLRVHLGAQPVRGS